MFAIPAGSSSGLYRGISLSGIASQDDDFNSIFDHALSRGVDILNLSVGFHGIIDNYSGQELRTNFGDAIAAMAQAGAAEKTIIVWAAGNAHGDPCTAGTRNCIGGTTDPPVDGTIDAVSVEILPGLPARITRLRGHSIAVVAVGSDTNADGYPDIASFSNRCGIAADWCIVAPGASVRVAVFGEIDGVEGSRGIGSASGTSFAAPMVSGGLAVMKQLFRDQLANTALVERLYQTASKDGPYSDRATYGQGLMDLGAATSPVGPTSVIMGQTVGSTGADIHATGIRSGQAFGDALARSISGQEMVAFGRFGAPFWYRLSAFAALEDGPRLSVHLDDLLSGATELRSDRRRLTAPPPRWSGVRHETTRVDHLLQFGVVGSQERIAGGHLSLARGALALSFKPFDRVKAAAFGTTGTPKRVPVTGVTMSYQLPGLPLNTRVGWLAERQTLLGTAAAGGFGRLSAEALFAGVATAIDVGAWRLSADVELGRVRPRSSRGLVTGLSQLKISAFGFTATTSTGKDTTLTMGLSQSLRVEDGRALLTVPVGRTKEGNVVHSSLQANLTPSGRQLEISLRGGRPLAAGGEVLAAVTWTEDPGHDAHARSSLRVLAGWRARF